MFKQDRGEIIARHKEKIGRALDGAVSDVVSFIERRDFDPNDATSDVLLSMPDVPDKLKRRIVRSQELIRESIVQTARKIEQLNWKEADVELKAIHMPEKMRAKRDSLVGAHKEIHLSFNSLKLTIDLFRQINEKILQQIERESDSRNSIQLRLKNALLVYELLTFLGDFIKQFTLEGVQQLKMLRDSLVREIRSNIDEHGSYIKEIEGEAALSQEQRERLIKAARDRIDVLELSERKWDRLLGNIDKACDEVQGVKNTLVDLNFNRKNARLQIKTLKVVAILAIAGDALKSIKELGNMATLELAPLDAGTVKSLLGVTDTDDDVGHDQAAA